MPISFRLKFASLTLGLALLTGVPTTSQVLAKPGWAGSGVAVEAWWQRAVFYRIHPELFQSSTEAPTGEPIGDLGGITQRLDYLQSLGIDAILLEPPYNPADLDDLTQQASRHHIRLLVAIDFSDKDTNLASARQLLSSGIAGLYLKTQTLPSDSASSLIQDLRRLTDSVPGDRVLLADTSPNPGLAKMLAAAAHLVASPSFFGETAASLRSQAANTLGNPYSTSNPLLSADTKPSAIPEAMAAVLLGSKTAVILDAGQELGADPRLRMQWTPSNITPKPVAPEPAPSLEAKPAVPTQEIFGTYKPYVAPPPPTPVKPADPDAPASPVDPNTLPGFTTGELPSQPANAAKINAAVEDTDPHSVLNFYRHMIQLHHGNPSLRHGSEHLLDHDKENALVWIRRAPAGSKTAATVVAVANLSGETLYFSLAKDLAALKIRPGTMRTLLASSPTLPIETTDRMTLPPGVVYLGELFHSDERELEPTHAVRHRRRR